MEKKQSMNSIINYKQFDKFPILESERLIFRKFEKNDAESLFKIRSNDLVMKYMDSLIHKNKSDSSTLISSILSDFKNRIGINWAIVSKSNNQLVGSFSFWRLIKQHCRAEIGYSMHSNYWGQGIMNETFKTLIEFGFNNLQLHSLEANVNPQNDQSIKLLERVGFKKEAHFRENFLYNGQFIDSLIFCLLETDVRNY